MPACGAILDLPDPTLNNDIGSSDGSANPDGQLGDGMFQDGTGPGSDGGPGNPDGSTIDSGHTPCGALDCLGGACIDAGICEAFPVYKMAGLDPKVIDTDGTNLFFLSGTDGIDRLNTADYSIDNLTNSEDGLQYLVVGGANFYFTRTSASAGGFWSCPTNGVALACKSGTGRIAYFSGSNNAFYGIAADTAANKLYFTYDQATAPKGVYSCTLGMPGCSPASISTVSDSYKLVLMQSAPKTLLWNDSQQNGIYQYDLSASSPRNATLSNIVDLSLNSTEVFFATTDTVSHRTPADTTLAKEIVGGRTSIVAVIADDSYVYWLDSMNGGGDGVLQRCPVGGDCTEGSTIDTLADSLNNARNLVFLGNSVYVTTLDTIWRVVVK